MRSGVHGVEMLFVTMGTGCTHVSRTSAEDYDVCVGTWGDGRIGTFRGSRSRSNQRYGGSRNSTVIADMLGVKLCRRECPRWPVDTIRAPPELWLAWMQGQEFYDASKTERSCI